MSNELTENWTYPWLQTAIGTTVKTLCIWCKQEADFVLQGVRESDQRWMAKSTHGCNAIQWLDVNAAPQTGEERNDRINRDVLWQWELLAKRQDLKAKAYAEKCLHLVEEGHSPCEIIDKFLHKKEQ